MVPKPVPVQEVAFVLDQVSVVPWPAVTDVGESEREAVGTVMVVEVDTTSVT